MFIGKTWNGKRNLFVSWDEETHEISEENDSASIVVGYAESEEKARETYGTLLVPFSLQ